MKGRRLWLKIHAHGGTIRVYVTKLAIYADDGKTELDASYDRDSGTIIVRACEDAAAMKMRLHHELLHACFGAHSGDACPFLGRTPETRSRREEEIISFLEPIQFDLLVRNGFLKYPNPPRLK